MLSGILFRGHRSHTYFHVLVALPVIKETLLRSDREHKNGSVSCEENSIDAGFGRGTFAPLPEYFLSLDVRLLKM